MARIKAMKRYQQRHPSGRTRATHGANARLASILANTRLARIDARLASMMREAARNAGLKGPYRAQARCRMGVTLVGPTTPSSPSAARTVSAMYDGAK